MCNTQTLTVSACSVRHRRQQHDVAPSDLPLFGGLSASVVIVYFADVSEGCLQGFPSSIIQHKFHLNSQRMIGFNLGISPFFFFSCDLNVWCGCLYWNQGGFVKKTPLLPGLAICSQLWSKYSVCLARFPPSS